MAEESVAKKILDGAKLTAEVVLLFCNIFLTYLKAAYEVFVPPQLKSVEGEVILITGTGHGMGREVALKLSKLNAKIVCVDINQKSNQETVNLIRDKNGGRAYRYECDVTDLKAVMELKEKVTREVGEVSILINNAGIMPCKPLLQHTEKEIRSVFDVNLISHHWTCQAFLPSMMKRNHGHIVALSSIAGTMGFRNLVPYCATKYGVRGFMEALSEELRESDTDYSGIKFTTICPYMVDTGLCQKPRIRFPNLLKMVTPQDAADQIVDAIRRDYFIVTVPAPFLYLGMFYAGQPRKITLLCKDFFDTGVEAHN